MTQSAITSGQYWRPRKLQKFILHLWGLTCVSDRTTDTVESIRLRITKRANKMHRVNVLSIMHRCLTCISDRTTDTVGSHTIRIARYRQGLAVYQQGLAVYPPARLRD